MNLREIEENVGAVDTSQGFDLIYDLLLAYGLPKASVSRLRTGSYDKSDYDSEKLWKGKVFYRYVETGEADLHALIDTTETDERIVRERPRFLIVRDDDRLLAIDMKTRDSLDIALSELANNAAFFMPWAGLEKTAIENANLADIKAAERMARLYDEIIKHNEIESDAAVHHLNVFFSRLLFCFFAEDTEVFEKGQFTNAVASLTQESGADVGTFLDELFEVLNTAPEERGDLPEHFRTFGYVNGKLFDQSAPSPKFSAKARRIVLECGELDWAQINPDIFGSMIQAVVHPGERESLGMHYTSVENIMKVLRPLFLDDLEKEYEKAIDEVRKLEKLLERLDEIRVFDPACGSGNFLVIAYKELRRLENRILQRITELDPSKSSLFQLSRIKLESFYGIEIDDFAHEIAILSLWLAKHQMNIEFKELFGVEVALIPLTDHGNIVCANSTQFDWQSFCPAAAKEEVFVVGNPPYGGSSMQSPLQKSDFVAYFGTKSYARNLDYVSLWFLKGARYISSSGAKLAFVTTNSISQGDHVALLWPEIFSYGVTIAFATEPFLWTNSARGQAGVTCVVVGLDTPPCANKRIIGAGEVRSVPHISPYLLALRTDVAVKRRGESISGLPEILRGSQPTDGGNLILSASDRADLVRENRGSERFIRRYMGAEDLLSGKERYCLWIADDEAQDAAAIAWISKRLELIRTFRSQSSVTAQQMADRPHRFLQRPHRHSPSIIVPSVSSERRSYVPMGFLDDQTVVSNAANVIYNAEPWLFGLLESRMHMTWMRAVAGRMKSDYRYAGTLVYNTFPAPTLSDADKDALAAGALRVLTSREQYPGKTLAQLYDPDKMPDGLRDAHLALDETVDRIYRDQPFSSDEERLELLFDLYETMISEEEGQLSA